MNQSDQIFTFSGCWKEKRVYFQPGHHMTFPLSDGQLHIWHIPITGQNLDLFPGNREVPLGHYSSCWERSTCCHVLYPGKSTDRALYACCPIKGAPQWALYCILLESFPGRPWAKVIIGESVCVFWQWDHNTKNFSHTLSTFRPHQAFRGRWQTLGRQVQIKVSETYREEHDK